MSMGDNERISVDLPDFGEVDPSILGISNPEMANAQSGKAPSLDNLYPEEMSNRVWSQRMMLHAGGSYIIGTCLGGMYGIFEGSRQADTLNNRALKMNSIINRVSRRGSATGNAFGILAIMFTATDAFISSQAHKKESWHQLAAAGITGLIYKSTGIFVILQLVS